MTLITRSLMRCSKTWVKTFTGWQVRIHELPLFLGSCLLNSSYQDFLPIVVLPPATSIHRTKTPLNSGYLNTEGLHLNTAHPIRGSTGSPYSWINSCRPFHTSCPARPQLIGAPKTTAPKNEALPTAVLPKNVVLPKILCSPNMKIPQVLLSPTPIFGTPNVMPII